MSKLDHGKTLPFNTEDAVANCVLCGRPVGKSAKLVACVDGGVIWSAAYGMPDETEAGYMGFYSVGSAKCAAEFETGVLFDRDK